MRARGFARTSTKPFLVPADFDYEKRRGIYVFGEFDPDLEFEVLLERMEGMVLYPNVTPVGKLYRRCDGVWLSFKDEVTKTLVSGVCSTVMAGGYPPQFEWAVTTLVERLKERTNEREAIARAPLAATQAYAAGALGEFALSELGYEAPEPKGAQGEEAEKRQSLYAGRLALWEAGEEGEVPHVLCAHAFRRVYTSDRLNFEMSLREEKQSSKRLDVLEELDGRSVMNAVEYLCRLRGARGYPHPVRGEVAYEVALMLESGILVFRDELPDPFPHT